MAAAPQQVICFERERLMMAYAKAVSDFNRMHSAQVAAVLKGDDFLFAEEIAEAARLKDEAKYAVLQHRERHGC